MSNKLKRIIDCFLTGYESWVLAVDLAKDNNEARFFAERALTWWRIAAREAEAIVPEYMKTVVARLITCREYYDVSYWDCVAAIERDIQDFFIFLILRVVGDGNPRSEGTGSGEEAERADRDVRGSSKGTPTNKTE